MNKRQFRTRIIAIFQNIALFVATVFEDLLIFSGLGAVVYATFRLSGIAWWYCLGVCLFGLGVWMTANPTRR